MKLLVYGSRMFGAVVRSLADDCGHEFAGFIDDVHDGADVRGRFEAVVRSHPPGSFGCVNAVGYNNLAERRAVSRRIREAGYVTPSLVHPRAYVASSSTVGAGAFVMAMASVDHRVTLQDDVVVWPSVAISHDSVVGENSFLSPACVICGDCRIGHDCFIGAGAVVVSHAAVPDGAFVKALTRFK
jgi:sugar O-acyltransferase (sialic acid O-acetyltransferase NeuD family)